MKFYKFGLTELKACNSLSDLARLLEVKPRFLSLQIYKTDPDQRYYKFSIPKKDGTLREITAPNANLKFLQSRLSRLLYQCHLEIKGKPTSSKRVLSHGFQKGRGLSIASNAGRHVGKRHVFNLDLEDFFSSFNFGRVRGYFIRNKFFGLKDPVATAISQLACHENKLPQGAPSSPIITELLSEVLDQRLHRLARDHLCSYSRYVDDITFSTNLATFPEKVAALDGHTWIPGEELQSAIKRAGFSIKAKKTRMQVASQRQSVNSLTVNEKVNIGASYYRGVRACAHSMMTRGKAQSSKLISPVEKELTHHQVWGMLTHIHNIKKHGLEHHAIHQFSKHKPAPHYFALLANYYHYQRIYLSASPVIVCEGKTDYIYLKEAIYWNINDARVSTCLANPKKLGDPKSSDHFNVDFLRHTPMAGNLLGLSGGGGSLPAFCASHLLRREKFHAITNEKPIIVIVDNDSQSDGMWSFISKAINSKKKIDGSDPYYHVGENLYVVPIQSNGKKDVYIEKLFPPEWLNFRLGTRKPKINQKKNEKLASDEYGKTEFAEQVIRANRGKVDCSAFLPLLHTICDIIER